MRILFLSNVLPHAKVISGPIIIYNRIRLLVERGHEVGLAAFVSEENEPHSIEVQPMLFEMRLLPVPAPKPMYRRPLDYLFSAVPPYFWEWYSAEMRKLVGQMVDASHYDVVVAEFSAMGQYVYRNPYLPAVRRIVSCHECCTVAYLTALRLQHRSLRAIKRLIMVKGLRKYEFDMYRNADHVLVLTPQERYGLLKYEPDLRISVIPYGVDVDHFALRADDATEESILYTGFYLHEANHDAVLWFAQTAWPMLRRKYPNLKFYVVGPKPTAAIRELARKDPGVIVTGKVDDVRPYFQKARVFVCPVRMGSGLRGKILEAMASGVPVVSTTLGAEGIPAHNGQNILLADTPHGLAESVDVLLGDPELRRLVSEKARELVCPRFTWSHSVDLLEEVLHKVVHAR
ncbi:MAG: glycosyltransferase [Kiritimatiellae bacterium]|nr:glycosyltransferase [Kiritimatiellia bacterium]